MTRAVRFIVSRELLVNLLGMPEETHILKLYEEAGDLWFMVSHPDLPDVDWFDPVPECTPEITDGKWRWNYEEA